MEDAPAENAGVEEAGACPPTARLRLSISLGSRLQPGQLESTLRKGLTGCRLATPPPSSPSRIPSARAVPVWAVRREAEPLLTASTAGTAAPSLSGLGECTSEAGRLGCCPRNPGSFYDYRTFWLPGVKE